MHQRGRQARNLQRSGAALRGVEVLPALQAAENARDAEGAEPKAQRELWPIPEFCRAHGISKTTAYELLTSNTLEGVKVGRSTLITAESVARWRASLRRWERGLTVVGAGGHAAA